LTEDTAVQNPDPQHNLDSLADALRRAGLATPARIVLDAVSPLDVVCCQIALFAQPFAAGTRWASYTAALSEAQGWQALRALLGGQER
jgi:hypothetical protein